MDTMTKRFRKSIFNANTKEFFSWRRARNIENEKMIRATQAAQYAYIYKTNV